MADTYQAVYDAVRSRISNGDVGGAVSEVARQAFDISFAMSIIQQEFVCAAQEMQRPSVLFRPTLMQDGNAFIAVLGEDLAVGIVGCGDTPDRAMRDFDTVWYSRTPAPSSDGGV